jgi:phosphoribosyl-ATP pyrophosphohydrolase
VDVDAATSPALNPWHPMTDKVDLKHMSKLGEEAGELASAACRCIAQGIDEAEPTTGKLNRAWLEDEIADVFANSELNIERFGLDRERIARRTERKKELLRTWHAMA